MSKQKLFGGIVKVFDVGMATGDRFGQTKNIKLPEIKWKTEGAQGGGMLMPVEIRMGMEVMKIEFSTFGWDADCYRQCKEHAISGQPLHITAALEDETTGEMHSLAITANGRVGEVSTDEFEQNKLSMTKMVINLTTYKVVLDGEVMTDIDSINGVFKMGGVDYGAKIAKALGR
jgi:P2 family phage contractile tail tube protein